MFGHLLPKNHNTSLATPVAVFGMGYLGLPLAAALAELGHQVIGADTDIDKIRQLQDGFVPYHEPGLRGIVRRHVPARLTFTTDLADALAHACVIFVCVGTPPSFDGSANLSALWSLVETIGSALRHLSCLDNRQRLLVIRSTVPIGTADQIKRRLGSELASRMSVISSPEFMAEGTAVRDCLKPHKLVVGGDDHDARERVINLYDCRIPQSNIVRCSNVEAEAIKLANNAMLAVRVGAFNEIANLVGHFGGDADVIAAALKLDCRVGQHYLVSGPGFGGSCLPKDLASLVHQAIRVNVNTPLLAAVIRSNAQQLKLLGHKLEEDFGGQLRGRRIAIWGVAFKPDTSDLRSPPSIVLIDQMLAAAATCLIHDPAPTVREQVEQRYNRAIEWIGTAADLANGADAVCLMHERSALQVPLAEWSRQMKTPLLVDPRRQLDPSEVAAAGFDYIAIGRPQFKIRGRN